MLQRFLATISMLNLYGGRQQQSNDKQVPEKIILTDSKRNHIGSCSKNNGEMNFSMKSHFLESVSRFEKRYKKIMRFIQCIVQVGMRLCKKKFRNKKECVILRLILNFFLS